MLGFLAYLTTFDVLMTLLFLSNPLCDLYWYSETRISFLFDGREGERCNEKLLTFFFVDGGKNLENTLGKGRAQDKSMRDDPEPEGGGDEPSRWKQYGEVCLVLIIHIS